MEPSHNPSDSNRSSNASLAEDLRDVAQNFCDSLDVPMMSDDLKANHQERESRDSLATAGKMSYGPHAGCNDSDPKLPEPVTDGVQMAVNNIEARGIDQEAKEEEYNEREPLMTSFAEVSVAIRTLNDRVSRETDSIRQETDSIRQETDRVSRDTDSIRRELLPEKPAVDHPDDFLQNGSLSGIGASRKRYLSEISEDTFSFLAYAKICGAPAFWLGMTVVLVQVLVFCLLLASVVNRDEEDNKLGIPANVSHTVRVGQFIAIAIAVVTQEDMRRALELAYETIDLHFDVIIGSLQEDFSLLSSTDNRTRDTTAVSRTSWISSIFFRFAVGALGLVASFVLIITQSTILDLLLSFTAAEYVSQLDDVAFGLAKQGFLGTPSQKAAEMLIERNSMVANEQHNQEMPTKKRSMRREETDSTMDEEKTGGCNHQEDRTAQDPPSGCWQSTLVHIAKYSAQGCMSVRRTLLLFVVYAALLTGWVYVVYSQLTGQFLCPSLVVQFDDTIMPELGTFSGLYDRENGAKLFDHVRYHARNQGKTWLAYCRDEKFWALTLAQEDGGPGDPCESKVRSAYLDTFDILALASLDWFVLNSYGTPIPMEAFSMVCYECGVKGRADNPCGGSDHGICLTDENECQCINGWYGLNCEFPEPCESMRVDARGGTFATVRQWSNQYSLLKNSTVYNRPVYFQGVDGSFDVMLFAGRRWVLFSQSSLDGLDSSFHPYFGVSDVDVAFLSEAVDMSSSLETGTPTGLSWYRSSTAIRRGIEAVDLTQPVGAAILCSVCHNATNPCLFGGTCNSNGSCDCLEESIGALCEVPPIGNARCDAFLNTPEYRFDGGDCCETTCENSGESICNRDDFAYFILGNKFCQDYTNMWAQYGDSVGGLKREGTTVALSSSGQTMAIGEHTLGTVVLYDRLGSALVRRAVMEETGVLNFGWSVALSGGSFNTFNNPDSVAAVHVAVGTPGDRTDNIFSTVPGTVYVYECLTGGCRQVGSTLSLAAFNISTLYDDDRFGTSVALSRNGDVVAVGAFHAHVLTSFGAVAIFRLKETNGVTNWDMVGDIILDPFLFLFGSYVALSAEGNVVAIASAQLTGIRKVKMVVEVRRWNAAVNRWEIQGDRMIGDNVDDDHGIDVYKNMKPLAMSDDAMVIAVGTVYGDSVGVQVYGWNGTNWDKRGAQLRGVNEGDVPGWSVDLSSDGSVVVVGTGNPGRGRSSMIRMFSWNESKGQYEQLGSNGIRSGRSSVALSGDGRTVAATMPSLIGLEAPEAAIFALNAPRCSGGSTHFRLSVTTDAIANLVSGFFGGMKWDLVDRTSGEVLGKGGPYVDSLTSYLEEACLDIPADDSCILFQFYYDSEGTEPPGGFVGFLGDMELVRTSNFTTGYDQIEIGDCSCPEGESRLRLEFRTDFHPEETTWDLVFSGTREYLWRGNPTAPSVFRVNEVCVPSNECFLFTVRDTVGDGLDSGSNRPDMIGVFRGFLDDEKVLDGGGNFGFEESHFFGICDWTPRPVVTPLACPDGSVFRLELWTDQVPTDTDWSLVDIVTGDLLLAGGPYNQNDNLRFIENQTCVKSTVGCAEFTMFDSGGDGICCGRGNGNYTVFWDGDEVGGGGMFAASDTVRVGNDCPPTIAPTIAPTAESTPSIECIDGASVFRLNLWTDQNAEATTFTVVDVAAIDDFLLQSPAYHNSRDAEQLYLYETCVDSTVDCVLFTIYDRTGDGLCCNDGNGNYTVYWNDELIATGANFSWSESVQIGDCPPTSAPAELLP